jgi:uncharacterized membrane protein
MKFLAAAGAFTVGLVFGAPFFGAVVMAAAAWIVVYFVQKENAPATPAPRPRAGLDDFHSLRAYVQQLASRVDALEQQLAGQPPKAETPQPEAPQPEAPKAEAITVETPPPSVAPPPPPPLLQQPEPQAESRVEPQPETPLHVAPETSLVPPAEPAAPGFFHRLVAGNIVAKVGAIVLFFGVGFLLKFAYDRNMVPPELRLIGVAFAAAVAFALGWKLKEGRRLYGLILQGVASGLLYLDVYFALKFYGFISPTLGFSLFALLGVATTLLAVRQDAQPMAQLGLLGAFLAPLLAATGSGNYVALFSYYLLLNIFILAVSWFRAWRSLNLTGWFFTFAIAALWGSSSYRLDMFWTIEPFLLAFFAIYLVIPVLFATRQPPSLRGLVDGTLVFGTPAAVAVLQSRLVWGMPYGLAWSAAIGALLYGVLGVMTWRHGNMRLLRDTYVALAVGLGTLAIFFAFGAYTTFALWSIEGAAILWVGLRQKHLLARLFGLLVQAAGAAYFLLDYPSYSRLNPYFNDAVLGCAIIVLAGLISASLLRRYREELGAGERDLPGFLLGWCALWWSLGGADAVHHGVEPLFKPAAAILYFSVSALIVEIAGARSSWAGLRAVSGIQVLALLAVALLQPSVGHPLANLGWLAWPAGLGSLFWVLHRQRGDGFDAAFSLRYFAAWIILAGVATLEAGWQLERGNYLECAAIALVGYAAAALRYHLRERGAEASWVSTFALIWSMLFWFAAGLAWIHDSLPEHEQVRAALLLAAGSALAFEIVGTMLRWPAMHWATRLPWLAIPAALLADFGLGLKHPFSGWFGLAWPVAWLLAVYGLRREEAREEHAVTGLQHAIALYAPVVLATWELWWIVDAGMGAQWRIAGMAVPASVAVIAVSAARGSGRWPLRNHWPLYRDVLLTPLIVALAAWFVVVNVNTPGELRPLAFYVPFLSPLDLSIAAAGLGVAIWIRSLESGEARAALWKALAALAFAWTNAVALRTIHYWDGVPYRLDALLGSVHAQAVLSILWTTAALALMALARRRMARGPWLVGAALLAVVVAKLFLVDLSSTGTVARIVSFLGVGVLLLVIGYVAPVPPGEREAEQGR